jgi:hypothetical protein
MDALEAYKEIDWVIQRLEAGMEMAQLKPEIDAVIGRLVYRINQAEEETKATKDVIDKKFEEANRIATVAKDLQKYYVGKACGLLQTLDTICYVTLPNYRFAPIMFKVSELLKEGGMKSAEVE